MRELIEILGALAGAAVAVFYLGSMFADKFVATRQYTNPDDVMTHHVTIYLVTLGASLIIGWMIGRILAYMLIRDKPGNQ